MWRRMESMLPTSLSLGVDSEEQEVFQAGPRFWWRGNGSVEAESHRLSRALRVCNSESQQDRCGVPRSWSLRQGRAEYRFELISQPNSSKTRPCRRLQDRGTHLFSWKSQFPCRSFRSAFGRTKTPPTFCSGYHESRIPHSCACYFAESPFSDRCWEL